MTNIQGSGGGGKGGSSHTPTEAQNNLFSNSVGSIVDLLSEGEIEGLVDDQSVYYNETPLKDASGNLNFSGVTVEANYGLENQPALNGFDAVRTSVSVAQALPYNVYKTVSFPNDGTVTAVLITIETSQFFEAQADGDVVGSSVSFVIERSQNGGSFEAILNGTIAGKQNDTYDVDYRVPITNATGTTAIRVKRTKPDATDLKVHDEITFKLYTKVVEHKLTYPNRAVVGHRFDAKQFGNQLPNRAYKIKGIKVSVPHNYDPLKRTYTGSFTGALSSTKQWTNNPAWVFYDIITSKRYGLGQFFDSSLIDIPSLYTLGKWCDEFVADGYSDPQSATITRSGSTATVTRTNHGYVTGDYIEIAGATQTEYNTTAYVTVTGANTFTYTVSGTPATPATGTITAQRREPRWACNAYITSRDEAFNVLKEIVTCFRGVLFWMDGKLWAQADLPRDPVKLVTNANVIDGNFTYSGESNRSRNSVVNVAWNDPSIFYRRAIETYEDPDLIREFGWKPTDLQAVGCTSRAQARRLAKAVLYAQENESELVTYKASFDHMAVDGDGPVGIAPGDLILISDYTRGNAVAGGRVTSITSSSVFNSDAGDADAPPADWGTGSGTVYIEHTNTGNVEWVACTYSGTSVTMTGTPTEAVSLNDLFIIVDTGFDPEPFRVVKINEVERNILEVAAIRYNEGKFNAIYGEDRFDPTNVMRLPLTSFIDKPTNLVLTPNYIVSPDTSTRSITVTWTGVNDPYLDYYEVSYSYQNGDRKLYYAGTTTINLSDNIRPGDHYISIVAVNRLGIRSQSLIGAIFIPEVPVELPVGVIVNLQTDLGTISFAGKDAHFKWGVLSPTSNYVITKGNPYPTPSSGLTDPKFKECVVRIYKTDNTLIRTESVVGNTYTYTFEKNFEDNAGVPQRSFKISVTYKDIYDRESAANGPITVSNPSPTAPTGIINTFGTDGTIQILFDPPTDPDFEGTIVWLSSSSGFTPGPATRVWKGKGNVNLYGYNPGIYYVRFAHYDQFGETSLNIQSQQLISVPTQGTWTGNITWSNVIGLGRPEDNANVAAVGDANRVRFSLFEQGVRGWNAAAPSGGPTAIVGGTGFDAPSGATYIAYTTVFTTNGQSVEYGTDTSSISNGLVVPVNAGERIFCGCIFGVDATHVTSGSVSWGVAVGFLNSSGGEIAGTRITVGFGSNGLGFNTQLGAFGTVPSGAVAAFWRFGATNISAGAVSSHGLIAARAMICGATANQTTYPTFHPGPSNEAGATIPASVEGDKAVTIYATSSAVPKSGQFPRSLVYRLFRSGTAVTSNVSWSATLLTGNVTYSISGTGDGTLTLTGPDTPSASLAPESRVQVIATYYGQTYNTEVKITKESDVPIPSTGGGGGGGGGGSGGTSAGSTTMTNTAGSSYTVGSGSPELTLSTGSAGDIDFAGNISFFRTSTSNGVSSAAAKWQYRTPSGSGTWTDAAGGELASDFPAQKYSYGDFDYGSLTVDRGISGLSANTTYDVRLLWRETSGTSRLAANTAYITATGS